MPDDDDRLLEIARALGGEGELGLIGAKALLQFPKWASAGSRRVLTDALQKVFPASAVHRAASIAGFPDDDFGAGCPADVVPPQGPSEWGEAKELPANEGLA